MITRFLLRLSILSLSLLVLTLGAHAQRLPLSDSVPAQRPFRCGSAIMRAVDTARARTNTAHLHPDFYRRTMARGASGALAKPSGAETRWTFNVFNAASYSYDEVVGSLRFRGKRARIWVDTAATNVADAVILQMARALDTATAPGSRNPKQGIVQNDEEVFGSVPVNPWSQDRSVDILMTDVKEDSGSGTLLGFFYSVDLDPDDPFSNHMNLLYIDSQEGLQVGTTSLLSTVAHELQHLIHYARNSETERFYDEGCAEEASILNGYVDLGNGDFLANTNIYLFRWSDGNEVMDDYERGMTFIHYLREQLGEGFLNELVGDPNRGLDRIDYTLVKLGIYQSPWMATTLLESFAVANLLRTSTTSAYGYREPIPEGGTARIIRTYAIPSYPADTSYDLIGLGSFYVAYTNHSKLAQGVRLRLSGTGSSSFTAMAILRRNGQVEVERLGGAGEYTIGGSSPFDTLIVALVSTANATQQVRVIAEPFVAGVAEEESSEQGAMALSLRPNPSSGVAGIRFSLASAGSVSLKIFDMQGREVRALVDGERFDAGAHALMLDAADLPVGCYVARLVAGDGAIARPLILLR